MNKNNLKNSLKVEREKTLKKVSQLMASMQHNKDDIQHELMHKQIKTLVEYATLLKLREEELNERLKK